MPIEQLAIYVILGAFFFAKFIADTLSRRLAVGPAGPGTLEPAAPELGEPWKELFVAPTEREAEAQSVSAVVPVPPRRAHEHSSVHVATRVPAQRASRKTQAQPALPHRAALGNRTELRRAVELMAILAPPRSLEPYDS